MKKLSVVCIEDDPESLTRLSRLIQEIDGVSYIGGARDLSSAVVLIDQHHPDVVFLDVHLGSESGFDLFGLIRFRDFKVIFCTAHEEHAIRAIRFSAADYLLKPFSTEDLESALNRVRAKTQSHRDPVDHLLSNLSARSFDDIRIALSDSDTIHYIPLRDVVRAEATGNYSTFYTTQGMRLVVSTTLGLYEDLLTPHAFFRVHRAHIVNLRHVVRFLKTEGGALVMTDGATIHVARRRKDELLSELTKMTQ